MHGAVRPSLSPRHDDVHIQIDIERLVLMRKRTFAFSFVFYVCVVVLSAVVGTESMVPIHNHCGMLLQVCVYGEMRTGFKNSRCVMHYSKYVFLSIMMPEDFII